MLRIHLMALTSPARHTTGEDAEMEVGPVEESAADAVQRAHRTMQERLGEAFVEYISRYPLSATPTAGGVAATIVVTIPLSDPVEEQADEPSSGVARILGGSAVTAATARRWACEAGIIPVVLGGESQPLELGREQRFHSRSQRIAMALRDGGCTTQHCYWPPSMCHSHHDKPWSQGGETSLDDGRLLCPRHHTLIHSPDHDVEHLQPGVPGGKIRFHRRI